MAPEEHSADLHHLRALHDGLETKIRQISGSGLAWDRAFDVATGNFLIEWFAEDQNQASNPEIWPYLTILVLPRPRSTTVWPTSRTVPYRKNVMC